MNNKNLILVSMNETQISNDSKYIIGTDSLSYCVGVILYDRKNKKAIVSHISFNTIFQNNSTIPSFCYDIYKIICENELTNSTFELKIIDGAYKSKQKIINNNGDIISFNKFIENSIKNIPEINISSVENSINPTDYQIVDEHGFLKYSSNATLSKRFAFNCLTGKFVTNDISFDIKNSKKY